MVTLPAVALALLASLVPPLTVSAARPDVRPAEALESDGRPERLKAIKELVKKGDEESLTLVVEALADADPYVADLAQTVVTNFDNAAALDVLLGKQGVASRDPLVQLRAAEALGRLEGPVDAQAMLRWVKKRHLRLARTMLWSMERLAARDALSGEPKRTIKAVRMLTGRGDHDTLRAAAIQTLSILDPYDSAIAMDNLKVDGGAETACALMDVVFRLKAKGYVAALRIGLEHDQPGVRMRALDILMRGGIKLPDLHALIRRLDDEPRAAVRRRVLEALQYFTGHAEGSDAEAWETFARTLGSGWTSAETTNSLTQRQNVHGALDKLEELDPVSDRLAVLLDVSASFWDDPEGRMQAKVSPAVGRILSRVDQTGSFLLVPFAEAPIPFSKRPIPATAANVAKGMSYLMDDLPNEPSRGGSSNIAAAIDHALSFPEIDRIIVVSASSEYVGEHARVALMNRLYAEQTRFRPAIFDFVLLNVAGDDPPRWYKLANARGGRRFQLKVE